MKINRLTEEIKQEAITYYKTNPKVTLKALDIKYGVAYGTFYGLFKRRKIPIKSNYYTNRKYEVNENFFNKIDIESKAYFLGLLYADGSNNIELGRIIIGLMEEDESILIKFKKEIGYSGPIKTSILNKKHKHWKNQKRIVICSKRLSNKLTDLGCVSRKSLKLKFPTKEKVPDYLLNHFIRGYFDGDGSISFTKKMITPIFQVNITSTNDFCIEIAKILKEKLNINSRIKNYKNPITKSIVINGNIQCQKFLDWLYFKATFYLERKYKKYQLLKSFYDKNYNLI